jgi:tetratricopeptide (TPR) repeat protein
MLCKEWKISDESTKNEICNNHSKLAQNEPNNPDFYYLSIRCMEDGEEQDQKFLEGFKKWKDHNWLAYASGYIYSKENKLKDAYAAYKIAARRNPTIRNIIALDAERIKRVLNLKPGTKLRSIVDNSDVELYRKIESGDIDGGSDNPDYIYYLLGQGKLEEAYNLAKKYESNVDYVGAMVAASKGITKEFSDRIMNNLEEESLNFNTVWPILGLYVKKGKDYSNMIPLLEPLKMDKAYVDKLVSLIKRRQFSNVDKQISELTTKWKAHVYVLSNIILDGKIPTNWKNNIKGGLFVTEKPYLNL